jgi:hypothetical protein
MSCNGRDQKELQIGPWADGTELSSFDRGSGSGYFSPRTNYLRYELHLHHH